MLKEVITSESLSIEKSLESKLKAAVSGKDAKTFESVKGFQWKPHYDDKALKKPLWSLWWHVTFDIQTANFMVTDKYTMHTIYRKWLLLQ